MVKITGNVWDVGKNATRATEVRVHADMYRTDGDGLVTTETVKSDVSRDGGVEFDVLPGMAVMHLVGARKNIVGEIPLMVPDRAATLAECILAARNAEGRTKDGLEEYVFAVRDALPQAQRAAKDAKSSADSAKRSADAAASSQEAARINESASWSARSQSSTHAFNAGESAAAAKVDAGKAAESASAAADSASVAKSEADRAATIAGSTKWVGTKLEVNGKLSPDLKGEKGDKGDTGARGAQGPRGPQGDLGPKGDKGDPGKDGTMRFEDLTAAQRESLRGKDGAPGTTTWSGLTGKPSTFPPEAHKHTFTDIADLPTISTAITPNTLVKRDDNGSITASAPSYNWHAATKKYVDNAISKATPPPATWNNVTGKPSTFQPASHQHVSGDVTDASNDIGKGKGGKVVKGRDSDGKVFTYTPISEVTDSHELVSKGWVDSRVAEVQADLAAQPKVQVVSSVPANPDPNTLYLIG